VGKWYYVIVMSGIQLGSGQITVFAVIPKLVSPCCHRLVLRRTGGIRHPLDVVRSGECSLV
jgi:hypothetical protein